MPDHVKSAFDLGSFAVALGTLSQLLPALAALLSIIWSLIRLYEWGAGKLKSKKETNDG